LSAHSVSHVKAMLPRNIMLKPSDQFMLLNRSVQPFPDVMPDRGGAKKDSGNLTPTQQKEQLRELRKRWEVKHNEHMRKYGF
ncbi:hypothetical protein ACSLOF_26445, partial [Escherichia coli]